MLKTIFIIVLIVMIVDSLIETRLFKIKEYVFWSKKIKSEEEIRMIMLADLHNHSYGKNNEKLLKAIHKVNPDLILVAGDMLRAKPNMDFSVSLSLMDELSKVYPIYYANGNHEYRLKIYPEKYGTIYQDYMQALKSFGVHVLENRKATITIKNSQIDVYGLEIDRKYYKRFKDTPLPEDYIENILGKKGSNYSVLLAHNPNYFKRYAKWGADLTLSGHIHGGVMHLPGVGGVASPQVKFFPKYSGGVYQERNHYMVLSRGLGTHTINIRINNPAELVVISLRNEKSCK